MHRIFHLLLAAGAIFVCWVVKTQVPAADVEGLRSLAFIGWLIVAYHFLQPAIH